MRVAIKLQKFLFVDYGADEVKVGEGGSLRDHNIDEPTERERGFPECLLTDTRPPCVAPNLSHSALSASI